MHPSSQTYRGLLIKPFQDDYAWASLCSDQARPGYPSHSNKVLCKQWTLQSLLADTLMLERINQLTIKHRMCWSGWACLPVNKSALSPVFGALPQEVATVGRQAGHARKTSVCDRQNGSFEEHFEHSNLQI